MKKLALVPCDDAALKVDCFVELAPSLHNTLLKAYQTTPVEENILNSMSQF